MKTILPRIATLLLLTFCSATFILAQQNTTTSGGKKITITKHRTDADGTEVTETIIKTGAAAENFDAEKYILENRTDKVLVDVRVEEADARYQHNGNTKGNNNWDDMEWDKTWNKAWSACNETINGAFLGVEADSDEDSDEPGLVIQTTKGSAAVAAGLRSNDKIMQINGTPINEWDDLTEFMQTAKPGDKVTIDYERNGKAAVTEATLIKRFDLKCGSFAQEKQGFMGVSPDGDDSDEPGVTVSIIKNSGAEKAGLRTGDVIFAINETDLEDFEDISDVVDATKPGDQVKVTYEREGVRKTVDVILGEQKTWNWNTETNLNWNDLRFTSTDKEACLGVYTEAANFNDNSLQGARITGFTDESPAEDVKMVNGDIITAVNGITVKGHSDLWNEIAKYKPNEKVTVDYRRGGDVLTVKATLKACKDNSSRVEISETTQEGDNNSREFTTWNWDNNDRKTMQERRMITIHRGEGDTQQPSTIPAQPATDRSLPLQAFRAFPNPTQGQVTIEFRGEAVPTVLSLFDLGGRQLFREEMNAFSGDYAQQFDLTEYAKGTILIQVVQGEKVFVERIVVN